MYDPPVLTLLFISTSDKSRFQVNFNWGVPVIELVSTTINVIAFAIKRTITCLKQFFQRCYTVYFRNPMLKIAIFLRIIM